MASLPYDDTVNQEPALRILQLPDQELFTLCQLSTPKAPNMTRLARHLIRNIGCVRRACRPSLVGTFGAAESKRTKQPYTQSISPNREPSLDPLTYHHVDSRISTTTSLESPSILQRPGPDLPIESVKLEAQDGSPQALSPEEVEAFKSQLSKIWDRMMTFKKHPQWDLIISSRPEHEWLSLIVEHTPEDVKSMLVSPHPPTPARLKDLPWSNTTDGGVLVWCTEAIGEQDSTEEKLYVYVGSASDCRGGLSIRKSYMLAQWSKPHDEALKLKIKDLGLDSKGECKELFIVPFENGFAGDVMHVRALVILARVALMIWLGAGDEKLKRKTKDLVPWGLEDIEYVGLAGGNPLELEINEGNKQKGED